MSVREIIQHSLDKNPLAMKEALEEEMKARIAVAIEEKMNASMEEEYDLEEAKDDDEDDDDMDESFDLSDLTLEELEDFMMSEDFEQLDEISQDTLRSYIKRASHSSGGSENAINKLKAKSRAHKTLGNDAEAKEYADKAKKRDIGLNRAIARHGARMTGNRVPVKGSPYEKALKKVPHSYFKEEFDLSEDTMHVDIDHMGGHDANAKKHGITLAPHKNGTYAIGKKKNLQHYLAKHYDSHDDAKEQHPEVYK